MHRPIHQSALKGLGRTPRLAARGLINAYRHTLSALAGAHCRHIPSCSAYADEAIDRFGLWAGGWMTLARLCRCQPFGTAGLDFVPLSSPPRARWFLPWRYGRWRGTNAAAPADTGEGLP
jgi:putative membrane protein insertion efficiency factor